MILTAQSMPINGQRVIATNKITKHQGLLDMCS